MKIRELITEFSKTRPKSEIIVGYGSGVKKQANDSGLNKQVDLILGVNDSFHWHKLNYEMNPSDYKSECGFRTLPIYGNLGTKINYLSYLKFEDQMFKIGVVSTNDLIDDLINWKNFFLAGRFQKPIEIIKSNDTLSSAININRMNALKTALLTSGKEIISERELYETLCSLSFVGDWRQLLHIETKNKVTNIVEGSFEELHDIYSPFNKSYCELNSENEFVINYEKLSPELYTLPENLRIKIIEQILNKNIDSKTLLEVRKVILNYFMKINIRTSAIQPIKGLLLNGFSKSMTYLNHKIAKK